MKRILRRYNFTPVFDKVKSTNSLKETSYENTARRDNLKISKFIKDIEFIVKNTLSPDGFMSEFYQILKK